MIDLLDAMSELVYIVDLETYDILYMNASGKAEFMLGSLEGQKCYRVIQGRETPCDFCTTPFLKKDCYYTWETKNPITERYYLLKDKLVPWNGREARIEIAFDMTEKQDYLEAETLLVNCMRALYTKKSFGEAVAAVLEMLGEFSEAERICVIELENERLSEVYEWCGQDCPSYAERFRGLTADEFEHTDILEKGAVAQVIPPLKSDGMTPSGISVHIAVADIPESHKRHLKMILETLANFMASMLQVERYQKELEQLSYVDALTGVRNRNAYIKDMELSALSPGQPAGVVQMSVNGIKALNDRNSREYGDQVLVKTAQTLSKLLESAKVYRVGGDEFIALWRGVSSENFTKGIRKIKEWQERELTAKCALGYQWEAKYTSLQELVDRAEEQMYQDKKAYYRNAALPKRYRHSNDKILYFADANTLDKLLASQRFSIYFQPKFSVEDHALIGSEALIRFVTDTGQFLPPDQFIPFLEDARLIDKVDFYVFGNVCAKLAEWMEKGKKVVPVSVNFSRYTVKEPWFHDTLLKTWEKYRIPKKYIELEITESAEENCNDELLELLSQLRQDGFPVSIDDFGVKYANLSIFTNGDFSTLKVDRSLISDWENPRTKEILRSLCDICERTGVYMIAEGVELQEQLEFLKQINCKGVQGFLFSRPLPLLEYERLYLNEQEEE